MSLIEIDRGPDRLSVFTTPEEARRRRMTDRLIGADGEEMTERHLFQASAPEVKVALKDGRSVQLNDMVLDVASRLESALDALQERRAKVRSDTSLTDEGKAKRVSELNRLTVEHVRDEIAGDVPMAELEERAEELESQITALHPRLSPNDPEQAFNHAERVKEVRQLLRELQPQERFEKLLAAARSDDRATVLAAEDTPPSFPLVSPDELALIRESHVAVRYPERKARLDAIRSGIRRVRQNINSAVSILTEETGINVTMPWPRSGRSVAAEEAEHALEAATQ